MSEAANPPSIVIFARWPQAGKVKTRLAGIYGDAGAARVYRRLLDHTLAAAKASGLPVELRVTGASCAQFEEEFGPGLAVTDQGIGDLGARMARVEPPALVIGSDLPALTPELLLEAAALLETHEVVIGPARDGGYWLIGLREASPWLFEDMAWSTPQVLAETLVRLEARGLTPALLPELADIDEPGDLANWPEFAP
jgi:rSAM/selenodomain-associated transferase 1